MARIRMQNAQNLTMEDCFTLFLSATAAKGVKDKTLRFKQIHVNERPPILEISGLLTFLPNHHRCQINL